MAEITQERAGPKSMVAVAFTATIFLSASLLFFVQPLFTKMVLPLIGGAPAVWTTAMLFFQTVLIAGYLYAHVSTRYLPGKVQVGLHVALWAVALLTLPLAVKEAWAPKASTSPIWQTLAIYALGVGLPFAVLSANAPLLQHWYSKTKGPSANDPYFLYGASNLGSLLALIGFPLLAEPLFGARDISSAWSIGFVVFGGGLLLCGFMQRTRGAEAKVLDKINVPAPAPATKTIVYWLFLAFVPSSLMLACLLYTSDAADE